VVRQATQPTTARVAIAAWQKGQRSAADVRGRASRAGGAAGSGVAVQTASTRPTRAPTRSHGPPAFAAVERTARRVARGSAVATWARAYVWLHPRSGHDDRAAGDPGSARGGASARPVRTGEHHFASARDAASMAPEAARISRAKRDARGLSPERRSMRPAGDRGAVLVVGRGAEPRASPRRRRAASRPLSVERPSLPRLPCPARQGGWRPRRQPPLPSPRRSSRSNRVSPNRRTPVLYALNSRH